MFITPVVDFKTPILIFSLKYLSLTESCMIIWLPHLHIKTENLLENELLTKVSGRTICVLYKLNVKS